MTYIIVEKDNPLAVHGIFDSKARADTHLKNIIPHYVANGYFDDKSLTVGSFIVKAETTSQ